METRPIILEVERNLGLLIQESLRECYRRSLESDIIANQNVITNSAKKNVTSHGSILLTNLETYYSHIKKEENEKIIIGETKNFEDFIKDIISINRTLKGETITIKNNFIDGSKLTLDDVQLIQIELQKIHTSLTGIPSPEEIKTDDELRNINSYEYLSYFAKHIPASLIYVPGFMNVVSYCTTKYNPDHPYGNYYTEFLLALEDHIDNLQKKLFYAEKQVKTAIQSKSNDYDKYAKNSASITNSLRELDALVEAIYFNRNFALERSYSMVRKHIQLVQQTDEDAIQKAVLKRLKEGGDSATQRKYGTNIMTPSIAGSSTERALGNIASQFKPMMTTSQPSIVHLSYKEVGDPIQLRFGTQGQIVDWHARVNPIFHHLMDMKEETYNSTKELPNINCELIISDKIPTLASLVDLDIATNAAFIRTPSSVYYVNKAKCICQKIHCNNEELQQIDKAFINEVDLLQTDKLAFFPPEVANIHIEANKTLIPPRHVTHIYFNNMSRVGGKNVTFDFERKVREDEMSLKLEESATSHSNLSIITLPSDGGLLDHKLAEDRIPPKEQNYNNVFVHIVNIANGTSSDAYANDFFISEDDKKILYGDGSAYSKDTENAILEELLEKSFTTLGFKPGDKLSLADQQAVYFHFLKFELTNYIIKKIGPDSFNFACKDAIDRGGVSSAFYNLMKSIEKNKPISQEEFERLLHGAPVNVKARGINKHSITLWNTIDAYLEANKNNPNVPSWLPQWRDAHAISATPQYHINKLKKYIEQRDKGGEHTGSYTTLLKEYSGFFGDYSGIFQKPGLDKETKLTLGKNIMNLLEQMPNRKGYSAIYILKNEMEQNANEGTLGDIIKDLQKHLLLDLQEPIPEEQKIYSTKNTIPGKK